MIQLLLVEDDASYRTNTASLLRYKKYEVIEAEKVADAIKLIEETSEPYPVVIADMKFDEGSGLDVLKRAKLKSFLTQVIVVTGYGNTSNAVTAMEHGAFTYHEKHGEEGGGDLLLTQVSAACLRFRQLSEAYMRVRDVDDLRATLRSIGGQIEVLSARLDGTARAMEDIFHVPLPHPSE
jgi:DNA-binding NtrC family response regulator